MRSSFNGFSPLMWLSSALALLGIVLAVSGDSKMMVWFGTEINVFGFLGVLKLRKVVETCLMKYFLAQTLGSVFIFCGVFLAMSYSYVGLLGDSCLQVGVLCKLGMFPVHMWFPSVMGSSDWFTLVWLSTVQKLGPLLLAGLLCANSLIMLISIVGTAFVGSVGGVDKTSVRGILGYSSLLNMGWLCFCSVCFPGLFIFFFIGYSCQVFLSVGCFWLSSVGKLNSEVTSPATVMSFLGISSIPPFPVFIFKLLVIASSVDGLVVLLLIMSSVLSLCYYMRASCVFLLKGFGTDSRVNSLMWFYCVMWAVCYSCLGFALL
uniref:NADH dehydrogenase subunit 2 n=1 Tax=Xenostrobus securis TaxID=1289581 RepID=UPI00226C92F3|nr:NADH dehydrogenase subunit 2 [Xenostrobus securis]UZG65996.1 NADH dehydrogenase subunit 2 [Xenostrobus securis]